MDQLGIDEAGRGPLLGPMVLAGLCIDKSDLPLFKALEVQDSKLFAKNATTLKRRAALAAKLKADFQHQIIVVDAIEIDHFVASGPGLNVLEQIKAQELIQALPAQEVILDGATLFRPLIRPGVKAINHADRDFFVVAGASILAKETRDQQLAKLLEPFQAEYGPIAGGGYANGQTLKFVRWYLRQKGELPPFYRKSYNWKALEDQKKD